MGQNIFVGVLCAVALGVGIWGWWFDNGGSFKKDKKESRNPDEMDNDKKKEQK